MNTSDKTSTGFLASFDLFPKVKARFLKKTTVGGFVFVLSFLIVSIMLFHEIRNFNTTSVEQLFTVNPHNSSTIPIFMNVSIAMPCQNLSVMFVNYKNEGTVINNILEAVPISFRYDTQSEVDGCNLCGLFSVDRASGFIRIMPVIKLKLTSEGDIKLNTANNNVSHVVHKLSFGHEYPGLQNNLNGHEEFSIGVSKQYSYFISMIPTVYIETHANVNYLAYQYAVNRTSRPADPEHLDMAINFHFDVDPICIIIKEKKPNLGQLLINATGIIGGAFTSSNLAYLFYNFFINLVSFEQSSSKPSIAKMQMVHANN